MMNKEKKAGGNMDSLNGKIVKQGYTFDDVLLVPSYSSVVPSQVVLGTRLSDKIQLKMPLVSAAMDTVRRRWRDRLDLGWSGYSS